MLVHPVPEVEAHGMRLDRNAPLPFEIHVVEDLVGHFPRGECLSSRTSCRRAFDLPWSIWAMIEKFRMYFESLVP